MRQLKLFNEGASPSLSPSSSCFSSSFGSAIGEGKEEEEGCWEDHANEGRGLRRLRKTGTNKALCLLACPSLYVLFMRGCRREPYPPSLPPFIVVVVGRGFPGLFGRT